MLYVSQEDAIAHHYFSLVNDVRGCSATASEYFHGSGGDKYFKIKIYTRRGESN